jgi:DNA-binding NarL/FixJ family response regulator
MEKRIKVGIVDDHQIFVKSIALLLETIGHYDIVLEAFNGKEMIKSLENLSDLPDIILLDVNMPIMNGVEAADFLHHSYPFIRIVALSLNADDESVISMFKSGCLAYLVKNCSPKELDTCLQEVFKQGIYYQGCNLKGLEQGQQKNNLVPPIQLTEREKEFLILACSDLTYSHIAQKMGIAERTVDMYRGKVFVKLGVQSRTSMALEAIRHKLVHIHEI